MNFHAFARLGKVAAVAGVVAAASAAQADPTQYDVLYDFSFNPVYTTFDKANPLDAAVTNSFAIKGFDASMGTLEGINFLYSIDTYVDVVRPTATFDQLKAAQAAGVSLREDVRAAARLTSDAGVTLTSGSSGDTYYLWEDSNGWYDTAQRFGYTMTDATITTDLDRFTHDFSLSLASGVSYDLVNLPDIPIQSVSVRSVGRLQIAYAFTPAVPEPASWAVMVMGVGAIGGTLRARRARGCAVKA